MFPVTYHNDPTMMYRSDQIFPWQRQYERLSLKVLLFIPVRGLKFDLVIRAIEIHDDYYNVSHVYYYNVSDVQISATR